MELGGNSIWVQVFEGNGGGEAFHEHNPVL